MSRAESEAQALEEALEATGYQRQIVVDWDGTCVPSAWPERPREWMPGAVRALKDMMQYATVVIFSARTSPIDPIKKSLKPPELVEEEIAYIRQMLDAQLMHDVGIWTLPGKPGGDAYIDDKAERYGGHVTSWDKMRRKMRMRFNEPDAYFPPWGREDIEELHEA